MKDVWNRIDGWLQENARDVYADLNDGASEEDIDQLEQDLDITLPADVRESYRIHNGQIGIENLVKCMWYVLPLEEIRETWQAMPDTMQTLEDVGMEDEPDPEFDDPQVQSIWWHPTKWIPLFSDGSGDLWCLDLDPTPEGAEGQIIEFWHDDAGRTLVAPSFRELMTEFANALENGEYTYDEANGLCDDNI